MKPGEGGGESRGAAKKAERPFSSGLSSAELHMTHPKRLGLRAEKITEFRTLPWRRAARPRRKEVLCDDTAHNKSNSQANAGSGLAPRATGPRLGGVEPRRVKNECNKVVFISMRLHKGRINHCGVKRHFSPTFPFSAFYQDAGLPGPSVCTGRSVAQGIGMADRDKW